MVADIANLAVLPIRKKRFPGRLNAKSAKPTSKIVRKVLLARYDFTGRVPLSRRKTFSNRGMNAFRSVARGNEWGATATALFFSCVIYNYTEVGFDNLSLVG